ncbi:MAG: 50S ribosomal protein L18 [Candidatus Omnitrophota bacterium]|nr:50S ribosomal protein L18 [Candidatus Omnitrophota bacterium]
MKLKKDERIKKRHITLRRKLVGNSERPRLSVHRSAKNLYVQVIDDTAQKTLFAFSTRDKEFASEKIKGGNIAGASRLASLYVAKMKEKGIKKIAFDRGGYQYHGRIKALAEALRQEGIQF